MICAKCGTENRVGRKYCLKCGAQLAQICPVCHMPNEPEGRFCGECGAPLVPEATTEEIGLASPAAPPTAERRLVSILFADLVGFTGLAERRDPEEVRDFLSAYFEATRDLIARYGGTVEKFIGDAVMAVWGTPLAHEDDPERAVRAALDLVEAVPELGASMGAPSLRLRAGVLTGEAAVTVGARGEGMVAGDLVNTASRLQSVAVPGTVLVGDTTYQAARLGIAFEEVGEQALKGKEVPVRAYRALRVVAGRRGTGSVDVLEPPFVGRRDELRLLKDLFHATVREARPRLVWISGAAGIGKSRLAWELFKYLDGTVDEVAWHQGRSPAYGDGLTFWALAEMVRMRAGIAETDDPPTTRTKLAECVERYVLDPEDRRWIEPRLAHLLGVEEAPGPGSREELFGAWRSFFERLADVTPTVLVFEDLQWADPGLIDFVEYLLEWSRSRPLFIAALARPELMDRRPTWGAGQRNFTSIHLEPLPDEAMRELLRGLAPDLPGSLVARVLERAEGIPLYAVETIRMLIDRGQLVPEGGGFRAVGELEELDVPGTLHTLIAARLDGLTGEDRTLLQDASVLGKTFTMESLSAVSGRPPAELEPRLRALVRRELLSLDVDPRSPERGLYGFVQTLIREVAYQTLSKRDRRSRHLAAAHHFEALGDEELASAVATHYVEAHRTTPEGPEADALAARAQDSLLAAADRAAALGSHGQALSYIERALALASDLDQRAALWERAGQEAELAADFGAAQSYLERAVRHQREQGDRPSASRVVSHLGRLLATRGELEQALRLLEEASQGIRPTDSDPSTVRLTAELARAYMMSSSHDRAIEWADRALPVAESLGLIDEIAGLLVTKATSLEFVGRLHESMALLRGALALAEEHGVTRAQLRAYYNLSWRLSRVDSRQALEVAREGMERAAQFRMPYFETGIKEAACFVALDAGEWGWVASQISEEALAEVPESVQVQLMPFVGMLRAFRGDPSAARAVIDAIRVHPTMTTPDGLATLAFIDAVVHLCAGSPEEAYELLMRSAALSPGFGALLCRQAGRSAIWLGDADRLRNAIQGLDRFNEQGALVEAIGRSIRATLAVLDGRKQEGREIYRQVTRLLRERRIDFQLAQVDLEMTMVLGPDDPDTQAAAGEARQIFQPLGALPFLERLEASLRTRPQPDAGHAALRR